jgi:hypothetical protein
MSISGMNACRDSFELVSDHVKQMCFNNIKSITSSNSIKMQNRAIIRQFQSSDFFFSRFTP